MRQQAMSSQAWWLWRVRSKQTSRRSTRWMRAIVCSTGQRWPPEPGAVVGASACDAGLDAAPTKLSAVGWVVVGSVAIERDGAVPGPSARSSDRGHPVKQRGELRDVVAVARGHTPRQRNPGGVDQQVVLDSGTSAIYRARAGLRAPLFAWAWEPSIAARLRSRAPTALSSARSNSWSCCQTPACCHSRRRRQQVMPDP